jgi:hypothetical protein
MFFLSSLYGQRHFFLYGDRFLVNVIRSETLATKFPFFPATQGASSDKAHRAISKVLLRVSRVLMLQFFVW